MLCIFTKVGTEKVYYRDVGRYYAFRVRAPAPPDNSYTGRYYYY